MARVSHKRVKQLLNEKRSKITDRQFFTSRILAGHFEDMAMAQTRRYKYDRRIHVAISWSPKSGEVACTNNLSVLINAGHKLVTRNRGRENRYVQSVKINGKPYSKMYVTHGMLTAGCTIEFKMGSKPNKTRGIAPEDKPFSMTR